jgi:TP901 family phage tail tape measure protein
MRMDKLAASIATGILPSFRSAGLQMNDFGAALATITDNATPADEAATRLRMTVSLMAAPSQAAVKALDSIGIGSTQLADDMRKPNGLLVAVMDLKEHLEKSGMTASEQNQIIQQAFGGGKTSGAILTLLEESDRLKDKYKELGDSASRAAKFQDAWAQPAAAVHAAAAPARAPRRSSGSQIGNFLIPKMQGTADGYRITSGW